MTQSGNGPVVIAFPGQSYGKEEDQLPVVSAAVETAYKIPPVIWMVIFLVAGYLGIRAVMED